MRKISLELNQENALTFVSTEDDGSRKCYLFAGNAAQINDFDVNNVETTWAVGLSSVGKDAFADSLFEEMKMADKANRIETTEEAIEWLVNVAPAEYFFSLVMESRKPEKEGYFSYPLTKVNVPAIDVYYVALAKMGIAFSFNFNIEEEYYEKRRQFCEAVEKFRNRAAETQNTCSAPAPTESRAVTKKIKRQLA